MIETSIIQTEVLLCAKKFIKANVRNGINLLISGSAAVFKKTMV